MNGVATDANPPLEWSESSHVVWKVRLPGHGSSTPILWDDRLYVPSAVRADGLESPLPAHARKPGDALPAVESAQEFRVLAIDPSTGKTIWERTATKAKPHEGKQENNSYASASALTDGERLYAYFGSWGLYCYDLLGRDGNAMVLAAGRELGVLARNSLDDGFDASPVLSGKEMYLRGYRYLYKLAGD